MPEPIRYDLLHEPWIPCERPDGSHVLVGIEPALLEAHTLAALHDESPLVTATLHRLLLAILQRVFLPHSMEDWVALWETPAFDAGKIRAYLGKWRERFDLFHPERPFLQVANLREVLQKERGKDPEPTEAWRLSLEASRYSGATSLFETLPSERDLAPAHAARALLGFLGFTPGGRIQNESESWKSGPLRGGAIVLVRGATLQRTLLCNLVWESRRQPLDLPHWERESSTQRTARAPYGPIDLLVWPSRRVELLPQRDGAGTASVRDVVTAAGERLESDTPDPMFGYVVRDPKRPPFAIRIETERSAWRDAAALFDATTGADAFRRPAACNQLAELVREGIVPREARFQVEILGLASDQAAIDLWRADRMPLPPALFTDGPRLSALRQALLRAEDLGRAIDFKVLGTLAENALAPSNRDAHKDDIRQLKHALGAMPTYWSTLGQSFGAWLDALGAADDLDAALTNWKRILRATARKVVVDAELHLGTGARALQAGAKAERMLRRVLREVLGNDLEATVGPAATMTKTTEGASA
jgi:CRISPR system Cascade subunit CasA